MAAKKNSKYLVIDEGPKMGKTHSSSKGGESIGEQRRVKLKIPKYQMYADHGNHGCIHVAFTKAEAEAWKAKLDQVFSVHIEDFERKGSTPNGHAYAVYVHG
jgi:hypothetical protein